MNSQFGNHNDPEAMKRWEEELLRERKEREAGIHRSPYNSQIDH